MNAPPADDRALRTVTLAAAGVVATVCVVVSYVHAYEVAHRATGSEWLSRGLPAGVDGLGFAGSARLVVDHRAGRSMNLTALAAAVLGLAASLAANVVAVDPTIVDEGTVRLVVAAYPPVALFIVGHLVLDALGSSHPDAAEPEARPDKSAPAPASTAPERAPDDRGWTRAPAPETRPGRAPVALPAALEARTSDAPAAPERASERVPERTQDAVAPTPDAPVPAAPAEPDTADLDPVLVERAERAADRLQVAGTALSQRALIAALRDDDHPGGVGVPKAKALLAHLEARSHASTNGRSHTHA